MKKENTGQLIPKQSDYDLLHIVNLGREENPQFEEGLRTTPTFRMHYVTSGRGLLYTPGVVQTIQKGDIFFGLPAVPYSTESEENLKYVYISYLGTRAGVLKENLKLSQSNCVFRGFEQAAPLWKRAFEMPDEVVNLYCESILLYIFSEIGAAFFKEKANGHQEKNAGLLVKRYLDEHYADPDLTQEKVGDFLSYHRKYVSQVFKDAFSMSFVDYLNSIRVHQACILIEQGFTSVQDIASMCGFRDPFYFSRVFRDHVGMPPKAYMETKQAADRTL